MWFITTRELLSCRIPRHGAGNRKPLSPGTAAKIVVLSKTILLHTEISKKMKDDYQIEVTARTVGNIIRRYKEQGNIKRKFGSGRKRKTTERDDSLLKREALKNRKTTLTKLAKEFEGSGGQKISRRTVTRRLKEKGIKSYTCAKKPLISAANRKKRLAWAKKHESKDVNFWKKVLWSDESRFCLVSDRPERCLRMANERLRPDCLQTTVKFDGGGIMTWGCFSGASVGRLTWVKSSIDKDVYIEILDSFLIESIEKLHPDDDFIFQQDNATCHTAKKVKTWLKDRQIFTIDD